MAQKLTISRLAPLDGVNLETVRYYERRGLLPKPPRTEAGYRQFPPDTAERLRFIKCAQELDFSLGEVGELLALRVEPEQKPGGCSRSRRSQDCRYRRQNENPRRDEENAARPRPSLRAMRVR